MSSSTNLWSDPDTCRGTLGAIQRDLGIGPGNLVFPRLLYSLTGADIQAMMERVLQEHPATPAGTVERWPFVPTREQRDTLFPNGPYNRPWHPMAEVVMTKALEWCRTDRHVTMLEGEFASLLASAQAA